MTPRFDGATYDPARDQARLATQLMRVTKLMADGHWRTLREIAEAVGGSEGGVNARLRDLRKERVVKKQLKRLDVIFVVERQRVPGGNGLHRYRVLEVRRPIRPEQVSLFERMTA